MADIPEEVEIAHKMVVVIEIEDIDPDANKAREILQSVKPVFSDRGDVKVYGAVRETADAILDILRNDLSDD
jgi:hypothetical protein